MVVNTKYYEEMASDTYNNTSAADLRKSLADTASVATVNASGIYE